MKNRLPLESFVGSGNSAVLQIPIEKVLISLQRVVCCYSLYCIINGAPKIKLLNVECWKFSQPKHNDDDDSLHYTYNIIRPNCCFHSHSMILNSFSFQYVWIGSCEKSTIIIIIRTPFKLNSVGFYWNEYKKYQSNIIFSFLRDEWKQLHLR